jgi:hypothetical protein
LDSSGLGLQKTSGCARGSVASIEVLSLKYLTQRKKMLLSMRMLPHFIALDFFTINFSAHFLHKILAQVLNDQRHTEIYFHQISIKKKKETGMA